MNQHLLNQLINSDMVFATKIPMLCFLQTLHRNKVGH